MFTLGVRLGDITQRKGLIRNHATQWGEKSRGRSKREQVYDLKPTVRRTDLRWTS